MNAEEIKLDDIVVPAGFQFAARCCGVKPSGAPDLSLMVAESPVVAVGVYTQNQVVAAPVRWCQQRTPQDSVRAIVTVSGNANACTGSQGEEDNAAIAKQVATILGTEIDSVLVMSTGVIGQFLPMDKITTGIEQLFPMPPSDPDSLIGVAQAIRTTDNGPKVVSRSISTDLGEIRIAGLAKGAGMIAPNMATFLGVMLTDAPLDQKAAAAMLQNVVDGSFNRCSVDGHTSTNDTCLLLASGKAVDAEKRNQWNEEMTAAVESAMLEIASELAQKIVDDGEGASHYMELLVQGAQSDSDAEEIARLVGESPLVKTAATGNDPNWGRIVSAAGNANAFVDVKKLSLSILGTPIYDQGNPVAFDASDLSRRMKAVRRIQIQLVVGDGPGNYQFWASDLTTDYVSFNSEYTT